MKITPLLTVIDPQAKIASPALSPSEFADAVQTHKAMVYSIAWNFLHDRPAAEEVAQEVFLQLHTSWNSIQTSQHLLFWLRRIATHRAIDASRRRKANPEIPLEQTDEPTMLERVHDTLLASYLGRMVATLPEQQRAAIVLRYQEDLDIDEISELLSTNASTVKTNIARGLEFLRGKVTRRLRQQPKEGNANEQS